MKKLSFFHTPTDFYIDSFMKYDTFESRNIILEGQGVERI